MRILVTGGTGYVGSWLCPELVDRGHDVTALSRSPEDGNLRDDVTRYGGDVTEYRSIVDAFEGMDAVVNLVALSPLYKPSGGDEMHDVVHRGGTENVVRAAERHDVGHVVQMSGIHADADAPTAYLRAKGRAEDVVRGSSVDWTIFRPTVAFGEGGEFVRFMKLVAPPFVTPLPGGGRTRFQLMWIGDFVSMVADAVEDEGHRGHTYEVGGPDELSMARIARMIHRSDGRSSAVVPIPMALVRWGATIADHVPGFPFGTDQYRSLELDLVTGDNDVDAFDVAEEDMKTFAEYLGVPGDAAE